jgi:hypothetical protein
MVSQTAAGWFQPAGGLTPERVLEINENLSYLQVFSARFACWFASDRACLRGAPRAQRLPLITMEV